MISFANMLRIAVRICLGLVAAFAVFATVWTLHRAIEVSNRQTASQATLEARQPAYRATATALASGDSDAQLSANRDIVLLQQVLSTSTPDADATAEPPTSIAFDATPGPIELPKLYSASNPAPGLVLSGTAVPRPVDIIARDYDLVNVILLGGDDELTEDNFIRTDTMIVVSLNLETGTVSMINLPRDLFVYIPRGSMGRLNTAYGIGENINWNPDGGFGLLRQTIFYNFGINVHYYARANFAAFETIIDRLGGVDIAVDCRYRDLYPVDNFDPEASAASNYYWRTLDIGLYTFDGFDALWYARTRRYTDDLDRGRRQQQLLRAMWRKARAGNLVTTIPTLWSELTETIDTNVPFNVMLSLLPYLVDLDLDRVQNLTFARNYHAKNWKTPGGDSVLLPQPEPIANLMRNFYTPPSSNQLAMTGSTIAVYNASGNDNWDIVASERLRWEGFNAIAMGSPAAGDVLDSSRLIDQSASTKGSLVPRLTKALNLTNKQVETRADPMRQFDYQVLIGKDYQSCTYGVLPIDD